ncbi:MAG: hypothetical protein Q7J73_04375 [Dehalococcoidales bacterium]|nr:hypothetical protein [Dehalococcoidales bacterium]
MFFKKQLEMSLRGKFSSLNCFLLPVDLPITTSGQRGTGAGDWGLGIRRKKIKIRQTMVRGAGKFVPELFYCFQWCHFSAPDVKILRNKVRKSENFEREQVFVYRLISQNNLRLGLPE